MQEQDAILFTDGSSRGNPGPGGWGAIVAVGDTVQELGGGEKNTTNNRMELTAILKGLQAVPETAGTVALYTDSTYAMRGATQWMFAWQKNGWRTKTGDAVANQDIWEALMPEVSKRRIDWHVVAGHVGIPGNERVDVIATAFADGADPDLYAGSKAQYKVDLATLEGISTSQDKKSRSKARAYSYLSLVRDVAVRHATWADCEARVRGVAGARFRKSVSLEDELSILKEWGVDPVDVERSAA